jgi:hydroxyacylglutathione hydrolase
MFQRYFEEGLAQASFVVACPRTREAAVIDPRRDIGVYVEAAARHGLRLVYAIETHVHADFVSGTRELAALGCRPIGGPGSDLQFDWHEARDGETIAMGDVTFRVLHTPGHTPEHISILVEQPGAPVRVFTGDTLFVGAVGRPDLLGEALTRRLAGELYESLFNRLLKLDDAIEVHPGHGAGSLCGAGIGGDPHSTIGQERRFNPMLRHASRDEFVAAVLGDLPETPSYFPRMKRVNRDGPAVLGLADGGPPVKRLSPAQTVAAARDGGWILDLRPSEQFSAGHPKGAVNIAHGSKVGYWAGWILPGDARIVLLGSSDHVADAQVQLLRVGLDRIEGCLDGGFAAWRDAGLPVEAIPTIDARELQSRLQRRERFTLLDVRTRKEFEAGHIDGAVNLPVGDLPRAEPPPSDGPVLTMCEAGFRSGLAASLLQRRGVRKIMNVAGGMGAYRQL